MNDSEQHGSIPEVSLPTGFSLIRGDFIHDVGAPTYLIRHDKTGAEILKVAAPDENRVFGIGFRTPITASDGRAHILEHSVLGGSKNYPLKDPFFEMIKSSLHTYMNAYTMPDQTVYPVASVHPRDFLNLMRAYLDAVFQPKLERHTFMREGWHFKKNPAGDGFAYGGIVFNEMKGMYASPGYHLNKAIIGALFPEGCYQHDSGGNPTNIAELTYEEFKKFHADHYQPSNSVTILYGAGDLSSELSLLAEYMDQFPRVGAAPLIHGAPISPKPITVETHFPTQVAAEAQSWVSLAWGMIDGNDPRTTMLEFISVAIMGFRGAPLYERLERRNLSRAIRGGYANYVKNGFFQITFEGTEADKASEIEQAVMSELQLLVAKPLEPKIIEAALHAFEFNIRERANDAERGINLMFDLVTPWLYGADPLRDLKIADKLAKLRADLTQRPEVVQEYLTEFFLKNPHRVLVTLRPSTEIQKNWDAGEQARLLKAYSTMPASAREQALADAAELERRASEPETAENIAKLPRVKSSELSRTPRVQPLIQLGQVCTADLDPHGVIYSHLSFNIDSMPQEQLPYAVLATRMMFSSDTAKRSFAELSTELNRVTGGLSASIDVSMHQTERRLISRFVLQGRALNRNLGEMTALAREVLTSAKLTEKERVTKLIREYVKRDEQGIVPSANRYAASRAGRSFRASNAVQDQLSGVSSVFWMREMAALAENNFDELAAKIAQASKALLSSNYEALVIADADVRENAIKAIADLASEVGGPSSGVAERAARLAANVAYSGGEGLSIPSQVNYAARVIDCESVGLKDHGANRVFGQLAWGNYLLDRVRFQGGAYGVSCGFNSSTNLFSCTSYRDPELEATLKVFREIPQWFKAQSLSLDDIDRGIIAVIRGYDSPQSVFGKALSAFIERQIGYSPERKAQDRVEVLSTTAKQLTQIADIVDAAAKTERVCVVGGEASLTAAGLSVTQLVS